MVSERMIASGADCKVCHVMMDALGFGLENFGPMGEWRESQRVEYPLDSGTFHELPIDASGTIAIGVESIPIDGPEELCSAVGHARARPLVRGEAVVSLRAGPLRV